ncbi:MAG: hypothetical protein ACI8PZ_001148 [Myxococcota bacterium]
MIRRGAQAVIATLVGCAPSPELPADAPTDGTRVTPAFVEFDRWTDYLPLMLAHDAECRFLDPLIEDDSTTWPPIQTFWVIYDEASDVKDDAIVHDTFFVGDRVTTDDFGRRAGKRPLGFKFLPTLQRSFLPIEHTRVREGRRRVEATFGGPIHATVAVQAVPLDDGTCDVYTEYCRGDCGGDWRHLRSIFLELGAFYAVLDVRFRD